MPDTLRPPGVVDGAPLVAHGWGFAHLRRVVPAGSVPGKFSGEPRSPAPGSPRQGLRECHGPAGPRPGSKGRGGIAVWHPSTQQNLRDHSGGGRGALTPEAAEILGAGSKSIYLGLTVIDSAAVARALAKSQPGVKLPRLRAATPEVIAILKAVKSIETPPLESLYVLSKANVRP